MNDIYMTVEEYLDFASKAHAQYMANRFSVSMNTQDSKHHPTDLAVESASFFEACYVVLDSFTDTIRNKRMYEQYEQRERTHKQQEEESTDE